MMKKMFNDNVRLVYRVYEEKISSHQNANQMREDLLQIGMLSLWKCCMRYDPSRGIEFSTYAYNSIRNSMKCALVRESKKTAYLVSMSKQVSSEAEDCPITYEDVIASPVNVSSEVEINNLVEQISKTIGDNAEKVISMIREGHSQVDIAKEMKLTRASVGRILKEFRKKLKNTLFLEYNNMEDKSNE